MIIVSGWLQVQPKQRQAYLDSCRPSIEAARRAPGCMAFYLAGDPLELDRINVFEQWQTTSDVEEFRHDGPDTELQIAIVAASVDQHEIASTTPLT
jgi:quinol monooxygenase YgiN